MAPFHLPPVYAILDPDQTKGRDPGKVLEALLDGGARIVQLRVKALSPRDFLELARVAKEKVQESECRLIVNDRVDIALACGADGVHLGQADLPLAAARRLMGDKIVGISTHNEEQAREAEDGGADYIGFGPLFGTSTKETGYAPRRTDMLRVIRHAVKIPIVAIGGIKEDNVTQVWEAGADSAAIISDILGVEQIAAKLARIAGLAQTLRRR